jgi:hypothetical protein
LEAPPRSPLKERKPPLSAIDDVLRKVEELDQEATKGPWRWVEEFPGAADKEAIVNDDGVRVLHPVSGWDRGDLGLRHGPSHTGIRDRMDRETAANGDMLTVPRSLLPQVAKGLRLAVNEFNNHVKNCECEPTFCVRCDQPWPCDYAVVLSAIEAALREGE